MIKYIIIFIFVGIFIFFIYRLSTLTLNTSNNNTIGSIFKQIIYISDTSTTSTGSTTGSVGSATGSVGSATGSVGSATGSVGSATGVGGGSTLDPNIILTKTSLSKKGKSYGEHENDKIDINTPYLINQLSINYPTKIPNSPNDSNFGQCIENETFKINNGKLEVSHGCSGVFTFKNKLGYCTSQLEKPYINAQVVTCDHEKYINNPPYLNGLGDIKVELIKEYSDNKCKNSTYGLDSVHNMYTDKECKGVFKLGQLFGSCYSTGERELCPIGKTDKFTKPIDKNIIRNDVIGLDVFRLSNGQNTSCKLENVKIDTRESNYNFISDNEIQVTNDCGFSNNDFQWGPFKGKCNPYINEGKCSINGNINENNLSFFWNNRKGNMDMLKTNIKYEKDYSTNLNEVVQYEKLHKTNIIELQDTFKTMISTGSGVNIKNNAIQRKLFDDKIVKLKRDLEFLNGKIINLNLSKEKYKKYCDTNNCPALKNKDAVFFPYDKGIFWDIVVHEHPGFENAWVIPGLKKIQMLPFKIENKKIYIL